MTNYKLSVLAGLAVVAFAATAQADITLGLSSLGLGGVTVGNSQINFTGSGDQFQWNVNSEGGSGTSGIYKSGSVGTFGTVPWTFNGVYSTGANNTQVAVLTANSPFSLTELAGLGAGSSLNGTITTATLSVAGDQATLQFIVSGLGYTASGSGDSDLFALASKGTLTVDLNLGIGSVSSVQQLMNSGSTFPGTFGGSISPVPEVATSLAGAGALGLLILGTGMARRSKTSRVRQQR